jgi:D-sedoheptulose 7-phosphate isomerase
MGDRLDPTEMSTTDKQKTALGSKARSMLQESIDVKSRIMVDHTDTLVHMADHVARSIEQGGKVMACGNGGSAADAQHLAAELLVRLRPDVNRQGLPAIALTMDSSSMTASGNDYSFEAHYERMTRALGKPGDVLVGITTSGRSSNVVRALHSARDTGIVSIGLLGGDGGDALAECDLALVVPSTVTGRIQESHTAVIHVVMELVEDILLESGYLKII